MIQRGVLLVGHGTRDATGTNQFFKLGEKLAGRMTPLPVVASLLEFQEPTIPQAWEMLCRQGVSHIHVAPLLLFAAGHAKSDVPQIVADCATRTPGVTFDQSRPLSRHPALVNLVSERIGDRLNDLPQPPTRTAIVMVGRGSHDPCAGTDMRILTEVVRRRVGRSHFDTAFYAMAQPRLPDVLDRVAGSQRFDTVLVHPHLLFAGRLHAAIVDQTDQASRRHPDVRFEVDGYLGPCVEVAEAIAGRIEQRPATSM